jgi:nucleotide-binding universal stress UspA family protein
MERIVVGVDGSRSAGAALHWAAEIAVASGSGLTVLHAYHNPYSEVSPEMHQQLIDERSALLADDWSRPALDAGATIDTRIVVVTRDRLCSISVVEESRPDRPRSGRCGGQPGSAPRRQRRGISPTTPMSHWR